MDDKYKGGYRQDEALFTEFNCKHDITTSTKFAVNNTTLIYGCEFWISYREQKLLKKANLLLSWQ